MNRPMAKRLMAASVLAFAGFPRRRKRIAPSSWASTPIRTPR